MRELNPGNSARLLLAAMLALPLGGAAGTTNSPYRGLWVGEISLTYANEVAVPLDKNNVPIAPDPKVPTPTADTANLRLILHVNGAGQVNLLKDVAILNRNAGTNPAESDSDVALVTDERLYSEYPAQPALRHASVAFDFGDSQATAALDAVVEAAARAVTNLVATTNADLNDATARFNVEAAARAAATALVTPIVNNADVAEAFDQFLRSTNFNSAAIDALAAAANPTNAAQKAFAAATTLQTNSFYADPRGLAAINAVLAAIQDAGADAAARRKVAQNAAASAADVANGYQRFIEGKLFGDMISAAADSAAGAGTNSTASAASIRAAVQGNSKVVEARGTAVSLKQPSYSDTRPTDATDRVLDAVIASAATFLSESNRNRAAIQAAAEAAGRAELATNVTRFVSSAQAPTADYDAFIHSDNFKTSGQLAAAAAAAGAVSEKRNNALWLPDSLRDAAKLAAITALRTAYGAAARAVRTELPLSGSFGPGQGDARLTWENKGSAATLWSEAAAGLSGDIYLPANHPTNPFRHRRHPDHAVGFDITRKLRFAFDAGTNQPLARAGFGVDRIAGTYREEIFGLHKPLGPTPATAPIGLRVEGRFELNRISLIDTLNAR